MLVCCDAAYRHRRSKSIGSDLHEWTWVLVSKDCRNSPAVNCVSRGEATATFADVAEVIAPERALPTEGELERLCNEGRVDEGFTRKQACFSLVIIMR